MLLIVSSHGPGQVSLIQKHLPSNHEVHIINPHELTDENISIAFGVKESETPRLLLNNEEVEVSSILWNSRPRADAILKKDCVANIATYRSRVKQFCDDLSFAFQNVPQYPGTLSNIDYGESKIWLMHKARMFGLDTPSFTINAVGGRTADNIHQNYARVYRKVLGFPCVVKEDGSGITTTNIAISEWTINTPGAYQPWQYQEIIPFVSQIRCFVVKGKVWAARWKHAPHDNEWDLRFHQEILGEKVLFEECKIKKSVEGNLVKLLEYYHLTHAAPEFLETKDGTLKFIDLNPCGEWMHVFSPKTEEEIADALASLLTE